MADSRAFLYALHRTIQQKVLRESYIKLFTMKCKSVLALFLMMISLSAEAQKFNHTYNGVTVTYNILSVPKHEVEVYYVPKYVTAVTIPAAVSFNGEAFRVVRIGNGYCKSGGGLFSECDDYNSFNNCKLLKTVELPNTIREIGKRAFEDCVWLRHINFPYSLHKIESSAFIRCESLTSIKLPASLKIIEDNAFNGCSSLNSVSIPNTIETIGSYAFTNNCKIALPNEIGWVLNNIIILDASFKEGLYDSFTDYKKSINKNAFGKYEIWDYYSSKNIIRTQPDRYLKETKGKAASYVVKEILIEDGQYETVLKYYPNDTVVHRLQRDAEEKRIIAEEKRIIAEANTHIEQGDSLLGANLYAEAREQYKIAAQLYPKDNTAKKRIKHLDDVVAELRQQRIDAERKARRDAEKKAVRTLVDDKILAAREAMHHGYMEKASRLLKLALDSANAHHYEYRKQEILGKIDSIRSMQALVSDSSRVFDYKIFRPDIYASTNQTLTRNLSSFLTDREKRIAQTHMTLSIKNPGTGSFDIDESSRALKKFCKQQLRMVQLDPLIIDSKRLKGIANFEYTIEYATGTVNVKQKSREPTIDIRFDMSPDLKRDLEQRLMYELKTLPNDCDGKYKFDITSMDINGQMEHTLNIKKARFYNGPQNVWRSVFVPGWGDKYVEKDGKYDSWKTVISYGFVGLGIYLMTNTIKKETTKSGWVYDSVWVEVTDPFYIAQGYVSHWVETNPHYETTVVQHEKKYTDLGIACAAIGAIVWVYDVIHVWYRGNQNKTENKERLGRISIAYNPRHNSPNIIYSLNF